MARPTTSCLVLALAALLFAPAAARAQVDVTLFVDPYPSPYIADWEVQAGNLSLTVMNDATERELILHVSLREAGGRTVLQAESDPLFFGANETQVYSTVSDLGGLIDYDSSYGDEILRTGRLPEGEFEICVSAEGLSGSVLSPEQCLSFTILFPDPAYLVAPFDGDVVRSASPVFQWTPLQVPIGLDFHFLLQIAEILPGQTPYQALTSNILHFESDELGLESLEYPIEAAPLEEGVSYAWWVQALDFDGLAVTANLGRSEVWTFSYADDEVELFPSGDPQSLRFVSADQASGPLADFDTKSFDAVVDELNMLSAAGSAIEIPLAMDTDFAPITIDRVNIYIDTGRKSLAIRGEKTLRGGKSYDIMFSACWGTRTDPRSKALAIKGASFDGFFPAEGFLDDLGTSQAWFVISCGNFKLKSEDLPSEVADYYGDNELGTKLGLNFFSRLVIADSRWLSHAAAALGIEEPSLDLHGFIGPKFGAVFEANGTATVSVGGELSLTAAIPLWQTSTLDGVIKELKGSLEIGAEVGYASSSDSTKSGLKPKVSAQIALEAGVSFEFLENAERVKDGVAFTGALKIEKAPGSKNVELSLELGAEDVFGLPAFDGVFSLHDPKVTVSFNFKDSKAAVAFSAKADVGRYSDVAEFKIERSSEKKADATSDSTGTGETPPPGGVPTPSNRPSSSPGNRNARTPRPGNPPPTARASGPRRSNSLPPPSPPCARANSSSTSSTSRATWTCCPRAPSSRAWA